jgi:hypothetical protein
MKFEFIAKTINSRAIKNNNILFFKIKHKQAISNNIQISDTMFFLILGYLRDPSFYLFILHKNN